MKTPRLFHTIVVMGAALTGTAAVTTVALPVSGCNEATNRPVPLIDAAIYDLYDAGDQHVAIIDAAFCSTDDSGIPMCPVANGCIPCIA